MDNSVLPDTRYALSDGVNIAHQVMGDGPIDLILVPGFISHIEAMHDLLPNYTTVLRRLSRFARVVTFDKRGQGLSDRITDVAPLEQRMDDVRAVMDAVGSQRAALIGFSEGSAMSALFAATYPERVSHLVLYGGRIRGANHHLPSEVFEAALEKRLKSWGNGDAFRLVAPSQMTTPDAVSRVARLERLCTSPGPLKQVIMSNRRIDVSAILPSLRVPTLVLHRKTDVAAPVAEGRALAEQIPNAKYIEYPEGDHGFWTGDFMALVGDIEEFVTGHREPTSSDLDRVLATILFTDIVDSTRSAASMGDQAWRQVLDRHDELARELVEKHRGNLIKSTGDGILATFDGPGRAVRCALAFSAAAQQIGLPLRVGLHTGEIEIRGKDIGGVAVHAAARVMAQCQPDEVLTSRVVCCWGRSQIF